jgi:hypothetical protein
MNIVWNETYILSSTENVKHYLTSYHEVLNERKMSIFTQTSHNGKYHRLVSCTPYMILVYDTTSTIHSIIL